MAGYEDDAILLDEDGVTIKSYRRPGDAKRVEYRSIKSFEAFQMGFWSGRYRLVGISPGRPRSWFHWNRHWRGKETAIALDVGGWLRPTIVPEDPEAVQEILRGAAGKK